MHTQEKFYRVFIRFIIAIVIAAYVLFPFFLLVINSGKETADITANPVSFAGSSLKQFRFNITEVINEL